MRSDAIVNRKRCGKPFLWAVIYAVGLALLAMQPQSLRDFNASLLANLLWVYPVLRFTTAEPHPLFDKIAALSLLGFICWALFGGP
jgi:hypothetical protein